MWVERGGIGDGLNAGTDAADGIGVGSCAWSSYAGSGHGGGGHRRLGAGENDAAAEVETEDAGYTVRAVVDCRAKWGGERSHVFWGERFIGRTEGCVEAVEGVSDGVPFFLCFGEGSVKRF